MKTLSPKEEAKLVNSIEEAIHLANNGMSPNDAILKVANEQGYTPPFVGLMVTAFNKSKAVHILKTASEKDRAKPFELADAEVIVKKMYIPEAQKEASQFFVIPQEDFSTVDVPKAPELEKTASASAIENIYTRYKRANSEVAPASIVNIMYKYAALRDAVGNKLKQAAADATNKFYDSLDDASQAILPLSNAEFQKMAQLVINGYPATGDKLVRVIASKARKEYPENIQKTANSAVFPTSEAYVAIEKVVEAAHKLVDARNALQEFDKTAAGDGFMEDFLAHSSALALNNSPLPDTAKEEITKRISEGTESKPKGLEEDLDPSFFNQLREIDTRRNFMQMALYDDDLNKYDFPALVKAYNNTIQMSPEAKDNPVILRNLMLTNLETGGIKDPFTLKTELEIGKTLLEKEKTKADTARARVASKPFQPKSFEKPKFSAKPPTEDKSKNSLLSSIEDAKKLVGSLEKKETGEKPDVMRERKLNEVMSGLMNGVDQTELTPEDLTAIRSAAQTALARNEGSTEETPEAADTYANAMSILRDNKAAKAARDSQSRGRGRRA